MADSTRRKFFPDSPNKIRWSDITEIKTHEGSIYLATMIDGFSLQVVGYSNDDNMERGLALKALRMARIHRNPPPNFIHTLIEKVKTQAMITSKS